MMTARLRRHLELVALSKPLERFARPLQADANASSFLVHQALANAFAEAPHLRSSATLEASLQQDIRQRIVAEAGAVHAAA
jgi:hypothetical protein